MLLEADKLLIERVNGMREAGFNASKKSLLPELHIAVFGRLWKKQNCGNCEEKAYDALIAWARRRSNQSLNQYNMNTHTSYKFKKEYWGESVVIHHMGKKYIINAHNLTDELAQLILSNPSKRHVLEPTGPIVQVHMPEPINKNFGGEKPKIEANKVVEIKSVTENQQGPNEQKPKVKSLAEQFNQAQQSTSTSTEQKTEEKPLRKKPGPKPKVTQ